MEVQSKAPVVAEEGYKWDDQFFNDMDGVIAVFDFDYDKTINFHWDVQKCVWFMSPITFLLGSLVCQPCFAYQNIDWRIRAQHVAVHRDGIK
jgi:hypothetical protein